MLRLLIFRTLVTNFSLTALGLVNSVLLSRWLGPEGRGEIAATMLWPGSLIYIGSMGIMASVIYFVALPESKNETIYANSIALAAFQSLLVLPIGFWAMPWLLSSQAPSVVYASRLYLLVIPIGLITQYGMCILQGRMHMSAFNWLRIVIPFGYLAGTLVLKATGRLGLLEIIIFHLSLSLATLVATSIALLRLGTRLSLKTDASLLKRMMKYGAQVQIGDISQMANLRLDQALMAGLLPPFQLGLYVVAVTAASLLQVLSNAVRQIIIPRIAQEASSEEQAAILYSVFRKYLLFSILAILAIGMVLPLAIPLVFGGSFAEAIWPAEILLFAGFFISAKDVLSGAVQALGKPWLGSRAELVSLAVTLALLAALLPTFGIIGAAIASAVAYATQLAVVVYGLHRSFNISPASLFHIRLSDLRSVSLLSMLSRGKAVRVGRI